MSLGPAEILVCLVVALIVFGPKRLPDVARQAGSAMRELRKMQDSVRQELHGVLHADVTPPETKSSTGPAGNGQGSLPAAEEPDHSTFADPPVPRMADSDAPDVGFDGPSSFS
jgi:sec-independent protein translocase protein TatA